MWPLVYKMTLNTRKCPNVVLMLHHRLHAGPSSEQHWVNGSCSLDRGLQKQVGYTKAWLLIAGSTVYNLLCVHEDHCKDNHSVTGIEYCKSGYIGGSTLTMLEYFLYEPWRPNRARNWPRLIARDDQQSEKDEFTFTDIVLPDKCPCLTIIRKEK